MFEEKPVHPWRMCSEGEHWVHTHLRRVPISENFSICAGIRWLFRKKQLAEAKAKRPVSWREAVIEYKHAKPNDKHMARFDDYYSQLKGKK